MINHDVYNESYYKENNYKNYLNKSDRYDKLASEILLFLKSIKLVADKEDDINILDYGCAVGLFLNGLLKNGVKNTFGFDVSKWALSQIDTIHRVLNQNQLKNIKFDFTFFLDVLEHMTDQEINEVLDSNNSLGKIIVRIPVSQNEGENFFLEVSRNDETHINCKTKQRWIEFFSKNGYDNFIKLNLNSIYDSEGVFCALFYKGKLY